MEIKHRFRKWGWISQWTHLYWKVEYNYSNYRMLFRCMCGYSNAFFLFTCCLNFVSRRMKNVWLMTGWLSNRYCILLKSSLSQSISYWLYALFVYIAQNNTFVIIYILPFIQIAQVIKFEDLNSLFHGILSLMEWLHLSSHPFWRQIAS